MMSNNPRIVPPSKPAFTFRGHKDEGFALDWSPVVTGRLATGDCAGNIHIWNSTSSGNSWQIDTNAFKGHENSVEDIQWSPGEATVFISASADKTVRVWDVRGRTGPQITFTAHSSDVNVISWNRSVSYLLASGSDDGSFKVSHTIVYISSSCITLFSQSLIIRSGTCERSGRMHDPLRTSRITGSQ